MTDIRKKLNIKVESPYWDEACKKAADDEACPEWMTERFLTEFDDSFRVLGENREYVLEAQKQVRETEELMLFVKIIYHILAHKSPADKAFDCIELPDMPHDGAHLGYAYAGLFPILAHLHDNYALMESMKLDRKIISDTFGYVATHINFSKIKSGYPCLNKLYFYWLIQYVNGDMLVIDRFEVQLIKKAEAFHIKAFKNKNGDIKILMDDISVHKSGHPLGTAGCGDEEVFFAQCTESNEYYEGYAVDEDSRLVQNFKTRLMKSEWELVFSKEDAAIGIHIPAEGAFDEETCSSSYEKIIKTMRRIYPDLDFKAFTTVTWLLSSELKEYLKETSNIRKFSEKYNAFPYPSKGLGVFSFVYNMSVSSLDEVDLDALAENTSLMKNIKKHYKLKKYIYEYGGFMLV